MKEKWKDVYKLKLSMVIKIESWCLFMYIHAFDQLGGLWPGMLSLVC